MLQVSHVYKKVRSFSLQDISFSLPKGYIMGFIGKNGAGKTTTLKCICGVNPFDAGSITVLGKDIRTECSAIRREIGFASGAMNVFPQEKVKKVALSYGSFFENFDTSVFYSYCQKFSIDPEKKVRELSQGMQVKLGIALALSHQAKLLILDEPTSALDPIARTEVLDILQGVVEDGEHSVLFSSHITSDLDKCADFVVFIDDGKILMNQSKEEILSSHVLIAGNPEDLTEELKKVLIGYRCHAFGFTGLLKQGDLPAHPPFKTARPSLEEIMVYYTKEANDESTH